MPKQTIRFSVALGWTLLITILSLITIGDVGGEVKIPYKDKMVHFVFYFLFVLLWFRVFGITQNKIKTACLVFCSAVGYGLLMELLQDTLTTYRTADIYDALANSSGALTGLLFIRYKFLNKKPT